MTYFGLWSRFHFSRSQSDMSSSATEFGECAMSLESIIMLAISAVTTVYLVYALLRPEKF